MNDSDKWNFWEVVSAVLFFACCVLAVVAIGSCETARNAAIPASTTQWHEGHQFIRFKDRPAVLHHPDCPCQHKTPEAE